MTDALAVQTNADQGRRKVRTGQVISARMDKTIIVRVSRTMQHPLIKKYIQRGKKYYAHDEQNSCNVGDTVQITECRPLSKLKSWRLTKIVVRAK